MARTAKTRTAVFSKPQLPAAGARIGVVCGPGEFARDNAGTVIAKIENRWGEHALVMMDNGTVRDCNGMNTGPGIGWHYI